MAIASLVAAATAFSGCSTSDESGSGELDAGELDVPFGDADATAAPDVGATDATDSSTPVPPCPNDMLLVDAAPSFCIDRFEAPNRAGELPLVMYTFIEADAWCGARAKRLCFDDEWTRSCAGVGETSYPYGDTHQPGACNDDKTWLLYDQSKLNLWPISVSAPGVESLAELLAAARSVSSYGEIAADHVEWLYQAEPSGDNAGCVSSDGVVDTQGNVEEWTRRRDGGDGTDFSGSLKGRYWAEARTCQSAVTTHGNGFRFYEIGFRCCRDPDFSNGE